MKRDLENRADIDDLMIRFYGEAMSDETIGYIFKAAELDLKHHLPIIGDFWETLLFRSNAYQKHGRNPLRVHAELNEKTPLLQSTSSVGWKFSVKRWTRVSRANVPILSNSAAEQIVTEC